MDLLWLSSHGIRKCLSAPCQLHFLLSEIIWLGQKEARSSIAWIEVHVTRALAQHQRDFPIPSLWMFCSVLVRPIPMRLHGDLNLPPTHLLAVPVKPLLMFCVTENRSYIKTRYKAVKVKLVSTTRVHATRAQAASGALLKGDSVSNTFRQLLGALPVLSANTVLEHLDDAVLYRHINRCFFMWSTLKSTSI